MALLLPCLKTLERNGTVEEMFFRQLETFCRMVQTEFLSRFDEISEVRVSSTTALSFTETLMLCPTEEAAQLWISRELPAALSFVLAIQGMQEQLKEGKIKLPSQVPEFQTRFYMVALVVREYLESLHAQAA